MKFSDSRKSDIKLYLPLVFLLVMLLGWLFYLFRWAYMLQLKQSLMVFFDTHHYLIIGLPCVVFSALGHIRHRSWRFYLPLMLPVIVIVVVSANFSRSPDWVDKYRLKSDSLSEFFLRDDLILTGMDFFLRDRSFSIRDYLKGKKLITPVQYFRGDVRFDAIVQPEVVARDYPHVLSDREYDSLLRKKQKTARQWVGNCFIPDAEGEYSKDDEVYIVFYQNKSFIIPRHYFIQLKGLTETDFKQYKP